MKKTIITLLALAGVAGAVTEYTATFADNKGNTLTTQRSHIIFGDATAENPLTLSSWMIEFSVTKFSDAGGLLAIAPPKADSGNGFGIRTHGGTKLGIMFCNGTDYYGTTDDASSELFVTAESVSAAKPLTLRFAYDAETNTVYLYDVTNDAIISREITDDIILSSVAADHDGGDINGKTQFYTNSGAFNFGLGNVTDMSSLAGKNEAFVTYVKTKTTASIPEPATATLSLLALAGLAARRRRK